MKLSKSDLPSYPPRPKLVYPWWFGFLIFVSVVITIIGITSFFIVTDGKLLPMIATLIVVIWFLVAVALLFVHETIPNFEKLQTHKKKKEEIRKKRAEILAKKD